MKSTSIEAPCRRPTVSTRPLIGALTIVVACMPACGPDRKAPEGGATGSASDAKSGGASPKAPAPVVVVPKPVNLKKLAMFEGGEWASLSPANASYRVKGGVKPVFEFHRKQFLDLGWKEAAGTSVTDQAASGTFTGAGYTVSVSAYAAGADGFISVLLHNHGNVDLAKLPLPPGTKPVYVGAASAIHVTEDPVAATVEAVRTLLLTAGWEPHGNVGDSWHFKQGLNRVTAMISSAPAQGGKTMINYSNELLTGELPVPPDAGDVRYIDSQQLVTFETGSAYDGVLAAYKQILGKTGWKPNRDEAYQIDDNEEMVFRSPGGDIIIMKVKREAREGKRNVAVSFMSAEDMAEADRRDKEEGTRIKAKLAAEKEKMAAQAVQAELAKPRVSVAMPAGASGVVQTKDGLKFVVGNGRAKGVAETWRKQFSDVGWKEGAASLESMAGVLSFTKENGSFTISYTDTGFTPAEVSISGHGVVVERK